MLNNTGQIIIDINIEIITKIRLKLIPSILLITVDIKKYGMRIINNDAILFQLD